VPIVRPAVAGEAGVTVAGTKGSPAILTDLAEK
jgi:hypothetical protein